MRLHDIRAVHLVGVGGINMSAVAKFLLAAGVRVSGSDVVASDQTSLLAEKGAQIFIGHSASHVPADVDIVVYTSAAPASNPEREEARRRGIREMTNFQFLGEWFVDKKVILVTGTHGKSTTTAMLGLILERAGLDPTVIVGSKVPSFADGNLRIGASDLVIVEGDEYAKHFLEFHPYGVIVNNIELDHTDVFPTIEDMKAAFRELLNRVTDGGFVVANHEDRNVQDVVAGPAGARPFRTVAPSANREEGLAPSPALRVPGYFNQMNAASAATAARELGASEDVIKSALEAFTGIWRRFEFLGEKDGARYYSDYGHHPTAVTATVHAAKELFPEKRILLCFQPHHRNRTKHLFLEFITCFDDADVLVLCEIYDVAGRDAGEDTDVSSQELADAVIRHDADRGVDRLVAYAPDPETAVERIQSSVRSGDVIIVMGAGDIDGAIRSIMTKSP